MPQQVLTLPGAVALSTFRVEKLLASLPRELAGAMALDARFVHFVEVNQPLDERERQTLEKLLTYGTRATRALTDSDRRKSPITTSGRTSASSARSSAV